MSQGSGAGPSEPVWVLDDPRTAAADQAIAIAERLDAPFRRLPLSWNWLGPAAWFSRGGSLLGLSHAGRGVEEPTWLDRGTPLAALTTAGGPALVLSSGFRAAAVALWLKERMGAHVVQCQGPVLGAARFDLLVLPEDRPAPAAVPVLRVLGAPGRVSPLVLLQAGEAWRERLAHLPRPLVTLVVGGGRFGPDLSPALAHGLGRRVARLAAARGGAVLALTGPTTGAEATEALAAGLGPVMSLLHRHGEPGADPILGFLGLADAVVITADAADTLVWACAGAGAVFVALPELAGRRERRLIESLLAASQIRRLGADLAPWPRPRLDESGRVALEITRRFRLG